MISLSVLHLALGLSSPCFFSQFMENSREFFLKVKSWFGVLLVEGCAGIVWGRGNFLYSGWYGTVFQICAEYMIDNIEIFFFS